MPTLKGTEVSLSQVQHSLYLAASSVNASGVHSPGLDTFQTDLLCRCRERGIWTIQASTHPPAHHPSERKQHFNQNPRPFHTDFLNERMYR